MTDMISPSGRWDTWKERLLIVLGMASVLFALSVMGQGHLSIDEMIYHHMVRSLWDSGGFAILNGHQDVPVPSLALQLTVLHDGAMEAQYPPFLAVIAAPLYGMLGYRGLFVLNALAFCGLVWLTYRIALRIFADRTLALNACLILALATYIWDYAEAAWPHALSTLFVTAAAYAALRALTESEPRASLGWGFAAGLITGVGVGVRIDAIFVLPALVVPLLFVRPVRLSAVAAVGAGLAPGLVVIALINRTRFGIASPFTYGRPASGSAIDPWTYAPLAVFGLGALALLWAASRPAMRARIAAHRWPFAVGAALAGAAALAVPEIWAITARMADGLWQLVVDLRIRDLAIKEGGLTRGPGGGMIYMGLLKTSLLQNCPYLVALLVPLWALLRGRDHAREIGLLFLVPASFIAVYSYFAWHGGLCLNMRYFVPVLPFTSILSAYALVALGRRTAGSGLAMKAGAALAALLIVGAAVVPARFVTEMPDAEFTVLTLPLILSGVLLLAIGAALWAPRAVVRGAAPAALAGLMVAFTWAGLVTYTYDFPHDWAMRMVRAINAEKVVAVTGRNAAVAVEHPGPVSGLINYPGVTVFQPRRDDFASFRMLVGRYAAAGRPVYGYFSAAYWRKIRDRGLLAAIAAKPAAVIAGRALVRLNPHRSFAAAPAPTAAVNP